VRLGIEPEPGNIVADADLAARLLREVGDGAPLGIVFDPANLLTPDTVNRQDEILGRALDLLGPHILSAHAKDVVVSGYSAAGAGLMDYRRMLAQLDRIPAVPLIVQDVDERDARRVRVDLQRWYHDAQRGQW
jgi:sugar phosphate isomerase/epimerase